MGILQRHAGHHNGIVVIISKDQRFRHEGITVTSVRSARLRVPECPFIFSAVAIIDPTCDKMSRFFHSTESISITFSSGCRWHKRWSNEREREREISRVYTQIREVTNDRSICSPPGNVQADIVVSACLSLRFTSPWLREKEMHRWWVTYACTARSDFHWSRAISHRSASTSAMRAAINLPSH